MPDMRHQLYEARHHSEFTASIWVHVAADVIQRLRPLAFACIEHLTSASTVERDLQAIEERLLGLAESCACTLFAGGVRIEDLDPEDVYRLDQMRDGQRAAFCTYVVCSEVLVLFGLARGNCAMPEVWPAMLLRALFEEMQSIEQRMPSLAMPDLGFDLR